MGNFLVIGALESLITIVKCFIRLTTGQSAWELAHSQSKQKTFILRANVMGRVGRAVASNGHWFESSRVQFETSINCIEKTKILK